MGKKLSAIILGAKEVILVPLKMKYLYQISKVMIACLILLEVHVSYTVEVCKSH